MSNNFCLAETSTINDVGDDRYHEGKYVVINFITACKKYTTDIFEVENTTNSEQSVMSVVSQPTQQSSSQDSEQSVVSLVSQPTQRSSSQEQAAQQNECDNDICRDFLRRTCGCKKADGEPCSSLFSVEHYITLRAQFALLSRTELDMVLPGSLMSTTLDDSHTIDIKMLKGAKYHLILCIMGTMCVKLPLLFCMESVLITGFWH